MARFVLLGLGCVAFAGWLSMGSSDAASSSPPTNDYPTAARSDYVFACMASNGGTQEALRSCSCSIDVIASILPYSQFEKAETIIRMRQLGGGYLASEFRTATTNETIRDLRAAQAEGEVRCF